MNLRRTRNRAAVRGLAHEAAYAGLLSPDLAAGIARVKGLKQLGQRSGNWLTQDRVQMSSDFPAGRVYAPKGTVQCSRCYSDVGSVLV